MQVSFSGFDELGKKLDEMLEGAESLSKRKTVKLSEMMNDAFVRKNTNFNNLDEFFESAGIHNQSDFDAYPDEKLDTFVAANTRFSSWSNMQEEASSAWISGQLGL